MFGDNFWKKVQSIRAPLEVLRICVVITTLHSSIFYMQGQVYTWKVFPKRAYGKITTAIKQRLLTFLYSKKKKEMFGNSHAETGLTAYMW